MYMKKATLFFLFALLLLLVACDTSAEDGVPVMGVPDTAPRFTMEATVCELGEKLTVNVTKSEYTEGVHLVIPAENVTLTRVDGSPLSLSEIAVGDRLSIVYNGQVMLSYPPQIVALSITVL